MVGFGVDDVASCTAQYDVVTTTSRDGVYSADLIRQAGNHVDAALAVEAGLATIAEDDVRLRVAMGLDSADNDVRGGPANGQASTVAR